MGEKNTQTEREEAEPCFRCSAALFSAARQKKRQNQLNMTLLMTVVTTRSLLVVTINFGSLTDGQPRIKQGIRSSVRRFTGQARGVACNWQAMAGHLACKLLGWCAVYLPATATTSPCFTLIHYARGHACNTAVALDALEVAITCSLLLHRELRQLRLGLSSLRALSAPSQTCRRYLPSFVMSRHTHLSCPQGQPTLYGNWVLRRSGSSKRPCPFHKSFLSGLCMEAQTHTDHHQPKETALGLWASTKKPSFTLHMAKSQIKSFCVCSTAQADDLVVSCRICLHRIASSQTH